MIYKYHGLEFQFLLKLLSLPADTHFFKKSSFSNLVVISTKYSCNLVVLVVLVCSVVAKYYILR